MSFTIFNEDAGCEVTIAWSDVGRVQQFPKTMILAVQNRRYMIHDDGKV